MVKLALTNHKANSPYKTAIIDLAERSCLVNHEKKFSLADFNQLDFAHPLLYESHLHSQTNLYCYNYDDLAGLLLTPRYIYATLIKAKNPIHCLFEVQPSVFFKPLKKTYTIPLSLSPYKSAKEKININQLDNIISQVSGFQFQFQDKILIQKRLYFKDLPSEVDGDSLYKQDNKISKLLNLPDDFEKLELRYINHFIGFGVFARQEIDKDECILFYSGLKKNNTKPMNYFFHPKMDSLNLGIDAREYGNTARFINHAPSAEDSNSSFLTANLNSKNYSIFGVEVVALFTLRSIKKGEQLLFDYSQNYFAKMELLRFKLSGKLVNSKGVELHDTRVQKLAMLRVFARNGVRHALLKLIMRYALIFLVILVLGFALTLSFNTHQRL